MRYDGLDNDCDPQTFEAGGVRIASTSFATVADALAVVGLGGSDHTLLDAADAGSVLRSATTAPVTLRGLTLRTGAGFGGGLEGSGWTVTDVVLHRQRRRHRGRRSDRGWRDHPRHRHRLGKRRRRQPPAELGLEDDGLSCSYVGVQTFTYDDGSGGTACP